MEEGFARSTVVYRSASPINFLQNSHDGQTDWMLWNRDSIELKLVAIGGVI
jgi:hypothetical protein